MGRGRFGVRCLPPALGAVCVFAGPAASQSPAVLRLGTPDAEFREGLTEVAGVRELSDGRVLVVDPQERRVLLLSPDLSKAEAIGREGRGPGEFMLPTQVFALAGDTSAIVDPPNGRLLMIDRTGRAVGFVAGAGAPGCPAADFRATTVRATDGRGRLYARVVRDDSLAIVRSRRGLCGVDTIAFLPAGRGERLGGVILGGGSPTPYAPTVEWAVSRDGRIAIVHPDPFHVVMIRADGTRHVGPPIEYRPVRLTEGHKQLWREEQQRPKLVSIMLRGGSAPRTEFRRLPYPEPRSWPGTLPPFLDDAVAFGPDGLLWIRRAGPAGEAPSFDLVDERGSVVGRVQLPRGRRVVGR